MNNSCLRGSAPCYRRVAPPAIEVPNFLPHEFDMTNDLTGERLTLKKINCARSNRFLLIRCPIARDENRWAKWEQEVDEWKFADVPPHNRIFLCAKDDG